MSCVQGRRPGATGSIPHGRLPVVTVLSDATRQKEHVGVAAQGGKNDLGVTAEHRARSVHGRRSGSRPGSLLRGPGPVPRERRPSPLGRPRASARSRPPARRPRGREAGRRLLRRRLGSLAGGGRAGKGRGKAGLAGGLRRRRGAGGDPDQPGQERCDQRPTRRRRARARAWSAATAVIRLGSQRRHPTLANTRRDLSRQQKPPHPSNNGPILRSR